MTDFPQSIANMVNMLPKSDQKLAYELVKKLVLAWDPDYTKLTPQETAQLKAAEESGFVNEEDINWLEV
ncbi:MAG: hypothetical protein FWG63_02155 [Defluviitaleaceae bacterium]|nr:hypothetical protein [Defluviitaleaceae bacterium]